METKIIGNKIAEARKKLNLSQAQLSERLFISAQAVSKWERGESMPDIITLNRLAEILGLDLNHFSDRTPVASEINQQNTPSSESASNKPSWNMSEGNWVDANFSGLKNLNEQFNSSNMQRCLFIASDLSELQLKNNHVQNCDFSGSTLKSSQIHHSHLHKNKFNDCNLEDAVFTDSHFSTSDFSYVNFTGTKIAGCDFEKNTLTNSLWNRCTVQDSQIAETVFDRDLEDCSFESCHFKKVSFENMTLRNCFFKNCSLKGIRFGDCQADALTFEFLRIGKADLTGLTLGKW